MAHPKSPTAEPTDAELLAALEESPTAPSIPAPKPQEHPESDVMRFFETFKIESGKHVVQFKLIYELYSRWSSAPISRTAFGTWMGRLFVPRLSRGRASYRLNKRAFELAKTLTHYALPKKKKQKKTQGLVVGRHRILHFAAFCKRYDVIAGRKRWYMARALFYLYDKWCFEIKHPKPMSYDVFLALLHKNFQVTPGGNKGALVKISNIIDKHITYEEMSQIHLGYQHRRKHPQHAPKKESTNAPQHGEIPSPGTETESKD